MKIMYLQGKQNWAKAQGRVWTWGKVGFATGLVEVRPSESGRRELLVHYSFMSVSPSGRSIVMTIFLLSILTIKSW